MDWKLCLEDGQQISAFISEVPRSNAKGATGGAGLITSFVNLRVLCGL